ncbi:protein SMG5 isoform X2 [Pseudomyrmex gracilis]|uniref:protein SMG5 isoform X2 n=1 Tax=Pseudomyrmex gracilis TaxID=219809 RepID=UPI000995500D|nr:protein SMG5 isoform X2 [Pseudomyrmex gracilis]
MRKSCNTTAEARTTDGLEIAKRLHRSITEIIKKLDEQKNHAQKVSDIFVSSGYILRTRLKDYCEKLILKDPVGNVHKTEELLWRKAFYEAVHAAKRLRKDNTWNDSEKELLLLHLSGGVGYYHHLILKLQVEYDLDLTGVVDFTFIHTESISSCAKTKMSQTKTYTGEVKKSVMRLIHRSLVCLGDLSRYKIELDPNWDPMIAYRYYKMAIAIDPNIGMPYNQLGTMAGSKNYGLDGAYHYLRSVLCSEPFEGAEGNLNRCIITHSTCTDENNIVHQCVSRLFSLLRLWDYETPHSDRVNQECQDLLTYTEKCLTMGKIESSNVISLDNVDNIETYLQNCKNRPNLYLTDDMMFKIVTICLMSISRLKSKVSKEVQGVVAITLAILSQLLQCTVTKLQENVMNMAVCEIDTYSSKLKNAEGSRAPSENNGQQKEEKDSAISIDNNLSNPKENNKTKPSDNGVVSESDSKKSRDKSKSLLSKLRRRKRRTSSDSDTSDVDHSTLASSSDEINSDVSETEEDDALSEENYALSEDALSDDNTDDEKSLKEEKVQNDESAAKEEINGHADDVVDKNKSNNKSNSKHLVNGEQHTTDQQTESKMADDKDSLTNSSSVVTVMTDSTSTFEERDANSVSHIAQLKKQSLQPDDLLNMLMDMEILASIKVCCDWLQSNPDIIRICAKSSRTLLKRVTILLNLIDMDAGAFVQKIEDSTITSSAERLKECVKIVPLPEDIDLCGLNLLEDAHKSLNWQILRKHKMTKREEMLLRTLKLIEFGHHLSSVENSGVQYDQTERLFVVTDLSPSNAPKMNDKNGPDHSKRKLMRHMGKLWLKAEVRALECQVLSHMPSPYFLVPDHEALVKHMKALKCLVNTKKFIVVIPIVVFSALDEIKRVSSQARHATRWLEHQFKLGSRFVRPQRSGERLTLPLIKGPKTKDKEALLFFQIMECCHYFTKKCTSGSTGGDGEAPVTLLTGCDIDDRRSLTFSPDGLAKSAGVNLEHIISFQLKWKSSSKSHG